MKKSITINDTTAFGHHLEQMIKYCEALSVKYDAAEAASLAEDAWRMIAVAVKFHWNTSAKENARRAVVKFRDTIPQNSYYSGVMGDFLNDIYAAFTGKYCKEV